MTRIDLAGRQSPFADDRHVTIRDRARLYDSFRPVLRRLASLRTDPEKSTPTTDPMATAAEIVARYEGTNND